MHDRIQINGVWYVREDAQLENQQIDVKPVYSIAADYQYSNTVSWKATKLYKDDMETLYDEIYLEFTEDGVTDHWDNQSWIIGVYEGDEDAISELKEVLNGDQILHFKAFLKCLKDKGWF